MAERSEADKVLAGMEIVSWGYKPAFWESVCAPQIEEEVSKGRAYSPMLLAVATLLGAGVSAGYAILYGAGGPIALTIAGGFTLAASLFAVRGYRQWKRLRLTDVNPATVQRRALFTSTGVLFGPVARLWKGDGYRLIHASIDRSGTSVRMVFTPSFGPVTTLIVPAPPERTGELPELIELLELKTPTGRKQVREDGIAPGPPTR